MANPESLLRQELWMIKLLQPFRWILLLLLLLFLLLQQLLH